MVSELKRRPTGSKSLGFKVQAACQSFKFPKMLSLPENCENRGTLKNQNCKKLIIIKKKLWLLQEQVWQQSEIAVQTKY